MMLANFPKILAICVSKEVPNERVICGVSVCLLW